MDKQEYISLRKQNNFTMIAFSYYKDNGGIYEYNNFVPLFGFSGIAPLIRQNLLRYFDSKFELVFVIKNGVIIGIT
jgi:hypothetical protein